MEKNPISNMCLPQRKSTFFEIFSALQVSFGDLPVKKIFQKTLILVFVLPKWTFPPRFSSLCIIHDVLIGWKAKIIDFIRERLCLIFEHFNCISKRLLKTEFEFTICFWNSRHFAYGRTLHYLHSFALCFTCVVVSFQLDMDFL